MFSKIMFIASAMFLLSSSSASQEYIVHKLKVATHPSVDVQNDDVDAILNKMNEHMAESAYPWDDKCHDIRFVRDGDVIQNSRLATNGTFEELSASLKANVPDGNVLVALGVSCSGVVAAGCGVVGVEPLIVKALSGSSEYYGPQLWLHERGHNVGLQHSAESPATESDVDSSIGKRFMFWTLGLGHVGKSRADCAAFRGSSFKSVLRSQSVPGVVNQPVRTLLAAAAVIPGEAGQMQGGSGGTLVSGDGVRGSNDLTSLAQKEGLTIQAYKAIAIPWIGDAPRELISQLTEADLESIRGLLRRSDSPYTSQAVQVLGLRGNPSDVSLLKKLIEAPLPAVIPGDTSKETRDALRQFKQTKIAIPSALGELAKRTHSEEAVKVLKQTSKVDSVITPADPAVNVAAQKGALQGLSVADTEKSREYLKDVLRIQGERPLAAPLNKSALEAARVVPLNSQEQQALKEALQKKD